MVDGNASVGASPDSGKSSDVSDEERVMELLEDGYEGTEDGATSGTTEDAQPSKNQI